MAHTLTQLVDTRYINHVDEAREFVSKIDVIHEAQGDGLLIWIKDDLDFPKLFYADRATLLKLGEELVAHCRDD